MSTSGSYSFTVTRDQIIRDAMLNIGRLDETEAPTAQEITDIAFKLNMLMKQWMGKTDFAPGLKVWTRRRGAMFLKQTVGPYALGPSCTTGWTVNTPVDVNTTAASAAAATSISIPVGTLVSPGMYIGIQIATGSLYWTTIAAVALPVVTLTAALPSAVNSGAQVFAFTTIAQAPLNVSAVVLRDNSNSDTPMNKLTSEEYDFLSNKMDPTNTGDPTAFYFEEQLGYTNIYTDIAVAQDVTKYFVITFMEPVQDVLAPSDNFEYPQEWFLALSWGLSKQIAPMFTAPWTPAHQAAYADALAIAQQKSPETTALYFQPNEYGSGG